MNIPPGYAQVNMEHSGIALPRGAQFTFGVDNRVPNYPALALANTLVGVWQGRLKSRMSVNARLDQIRVKLGPNDTGPEAVAAVGINGDRSNDPDSPQVAILVAKRGALGGRSNRGRWFLPYAIESDTQSGGILIPSARTAFQEAVDGFRSDMTALVLPLVILHNSPELVPTEITQLIVQPMVATQRRRLRRVGGTKRPR